jgi:hypothetical protein
MAWFGVGSGSRRAKPQRAQQFVQYQSMSVRSAAQISSPRNGLSICRIFVFGIIGRAMLLIAQDFRFGSLGESVVIVGNPEHDWQA